MPPLYPFCQVHELHILDRVLHSKKHFKRHYLILSKPTPLVNLIAPSLAVLSLAHDFKATKYFDYCYSESNKKHIKITFLTILQMCANKKQEYSSSQMYDLSHISNEVIIECQVATF